MCKNETTNSLRKMKCDGFTGQVKKHTWMPYYGDARNNIRHCRQKVGSETLHLEMGGLKIRTALLGLPLPHSCHCGQGRWLMVQWVGQGHMPTRRGGMELIPNPKGWVTPPPQAGMGRGGYRLTSKKNIPKLLCIAQNFGRVVAYSNTDEPLGKDFAFKKIAPNDLGHESPASCSNQGWTKWCGWAQIEPDWDWEDMRLGLVSTLRRVLNWGRAKI